MASPARLWARSRLAGRSIGGAPCKVRSSVPHSVQASALQVRSREKSASAPWVGSPHQLLHRGRPWSHQARFVPSLSRRRSLHRARERPHRRSMSGHRRAQSRLRRLHARQRSRHPFRHPNRLRLYQSRRGVRRNQTNRCRLHDHRWSQRRSPSETAPLRRQGRPSRLHPEPRRSRHHAPPESPRRRVPRPPLRVPVPCRSQDQQRRRRKGPPRSVPPPRTGWAD